jgi:hypothetical protein
LGYKHGRPGRIASDDETTNPFDRRGIEPPAPLQGRTAVEHGIGERPEVALARPLVVRDRRSPDHLDGAIGCIAIAVLLSLVHKVDAASEFARGY